LKPPNLLLLTLAETGLLGLVTLAYLHFVVLRMVWRLHAQLPRNSILFSVVALSGALVLSKFLHGMVDIYWSRGAIMITWASVGMATHAYFLLRRQRRLAALQAALESSSTPVEQAPGFDGPIPVPALSTTS
jgi:cation transport ATPase